MQHSHLYLELFFFDFFLDFERSLCLDDFLCLCFDLRSLLDDEESDDDESDEELELAFRDCHDRFLCFDFGRDRRLLSGERDLDRPRFRLL